MPAAIHRLTDLRPPFSTELRSSLRGPHLSRKLTTCPSTPSPAPLGVRDQAALRHLLPTPTPPLQHRITSTPSLRHPINPTPSLRHPITPTPSLPPAPPALISRAFPALIPALLRPQFSAPIRPPKPHNSPPPLQPQKPHNPPAPPRQQQVDPSPANKAPSARNALQARWRF